MFKNETFEQCHSAEKCKKGRFGIFSIHSVAKYQKKTKKVAFMIQLETTIAKSAIDAEINRAQMLWEKEGKDAEKFQTIFHRQLLENNPINGEY